MTDQPIGIDMACNDPDNGLFVGRVCQIQVHSCDFLSLSAKQWSVMSFRVCPTLREVKGAIVLSGKTWPVRRSIEWCGNWCWNRYVVSAQLAAEFLVWLHARDLFCVDEGEELLFSRWKIERPMDADDRMFIEHQLIKAALGDQRSAP